MSEPVILVCPCCASTIETSAGPEEQELECATCRQRWSMVVEADRLATFSLT